MIDDSSSGIALARAYWEHVVAPLIASRFPGLPYSAGRLGTGSDVLGLDDNTSRDHDWGLRLQVLVADEAESFDGLPPRFPFTGETERRHHVDVSSLPRFLHSRLGFDPRDGVSLPEWLSLSGQSVLEVVAGPVFVDTGGGLDRARRALDWYPEDVWRYVLACDWIRLAQELPLMGRAAELGDEAGSRVIAARLSHVTMHLAFLLERRWPPYSKWFGTLFSTLPEAARLRPSIDAVLAAADPGTRQRALAAVAQQLLDRQNALGMTEVERATVPFWDRPFLHPDPAIVAQLLAPIVDPEVRALPRGRGSIEQLTDNVDVLTDPQARLRILSAQAAR